ncbi:uncharacterized protein LOC132730950 [Ruditapes philippinarum]|uniref:uncharacterized protein LOC132730950 n=1 Tax=Ruditapes philippinarum TaxID=129788 RepID=UPI00295C25F3|nr:uncharacterized protein LOC132730950 [Ruditapes philippinarum]
MDDSVTGKKSSFASSLYNPVYCDICSASDEYIKAHGYCKNCEQYLCNACFDYHLRPKPSRNHILLNKDEMPKRNDSEKQDFEAETERVCTEHSNETLNFYCSAHEQFYCGSCIALEHRTCEHVDYIPDIAGNYITSDNFKEFEENIGRILKNAEECNAKCSLAADANEKHIEKVLCEIDNYRERVIKELNKREEEVTQKVNEHNLQIVENLTDKLEHCSKVKSEVMALRKEMMSLKADKKHGKMYILAKTNLEQLEKWDSMLPDAEVLNDLETFKFYPNNSIVDILCEPNAFGDFGTFDTDADALNDFQVTGSKVLEDGATSINESNDNQMPKQQTSSQTKTSPASSGSMNSHKPTTFKKLRHSSDIDIKAFTGEKKPWVTGITNIDENDNIHAIAVYNSQQIAVIDSRRKKIIAKKDVQSGPWDVTCLKAGEIIATLPFKSKLMFIKVLPVRGQPSGTMEIKIVDHVDVSGDCHSITNDEENLYVSYQNPGKIECLHLDGTVVWKIEFDKEGSSLFAEPQYIKCNVQWKFLYVTDWSSNNVICLSTGGEIKATFSDEKLKAPTGITVDKGGNVFVAGYHSNNIIQFSPTFKQFQIVLDRRDQVVFPQTLAFSANCTKVCVGFRNNEALSLYRVK